MNPFKSFTVTWWQGAIFKWGMLALGLAIGAHWYAFFAPYVTALVVFAAVCLVYVTYVWARQ